MRTSEQGALTKEWIAALRSGTYQQGTGALCRGNKYCCLGVLARVAKMRARRTPSGDVEFCSRTTGQVYFSGLYRDFNILTGFDEKVEDACITLNDGGASFLEIADYIESLD